jgi:hypothetical protein
VAATGGGSVLVKGVTRNGLVSAGGAKFFKLAVACPDTAQALVLQLTALQGNPDLYVSATVQQPGPGSFTWSAAMAGSDALQLDNPDAGVYYLAVHGATAAAFKLQARVTLTTGAPQGARRAACAASALIARALPYAPRRRAQAACPARASACWMTTRRWWMPTATSASWWQMTSR